MITAAAATADVVDSLFGVTQTRLVGSRRKQRQTCYQVHAQPYLSGQSRGAFLSDFDKGRFRSCFDRSQVTHTQTLDATKLEEVFGTCANCIRRGETISLDRAKMSRVPIPE